MFLGGCPCFGKKECWRCYGKRQGECCETDTQGAGSQYAQLVESGTIPPNDYSGLSLNSGSLNFYYQSTKTENIAGCYAANSQFGFGTPIEALSRYGISVFINWLDASPVNWRGPLIGLQGGGSRGNNNSFASETFIKKVSFGGTSIDGGEGCVYAFFYPDSKCDIPINPTFPPSNIGNDPQKYSVQEIVPANLFSGTVTVDWLYQLRNRDPLDPDAEFEITEQEEGTFSFEWDQVVEMAACLPCGEDPDTPIVHKCFDAPPDEDGWTPVGECSATEAECAENCPPLPCDDPCNSPFQIAGYIARDKAIEWKNSGGIVGDVFPGGPTLTGSIQSNEGVVTFENFSNGFVMDGQQATNITGRDVVFGLSVSANRYPSVALECLPTATSTIIDYAPMKDPANRVYINTQSYSPAFNRPAGTSGIIEISTGMVNVIGADSDKRVLLRSCSFGGVTYTNNIDAALPSTWDPIVRFVHKPWCAAEIPSGVGFGETFYIPHLDWSGKVNIKFDVVRANDFEDILAGYDFDWLWTDSFQQPNCGEECGTTKRSRTMPTTTTGPGTHLKNMLGWVGIRAKEKGCKCGHMEKKMNQGTQWCRDHKDEILDHLAKEAQKRGLPFVKLAASKLIDLAIRRSERG